jgi:YVTN family beta-propeller protein
MRTHPLPSPARSRVSRPGAVRHALRRTVRRTVRCSGTATLVVAAAGALGGPARADEQVVSAAIAPFPNFESGPVNALLLSPDGSHLYVLNTPDHRVEVYATRAAPPVTGHGSGPPAAGSTTRATAGAAPGVAPGGGPAGGLHGGPAPGPAALPPPLVHVGSVFTGLEPVAMALDPDDAGRLFVSNHVSDTVSVVDLARLSVVGTLDVGDEPQGLLVHDGKVFVACARAPAEPLAPGGLVPAAMVDHVVAVHAAQPPYARLALVPVGGVRPRDVVLADGDVHALVQNSGNRTVIMDETATKTLGLEQEVPDALDPPFTVNPVLLRPEFGALPYTRGWYIPNAGRIVRDAEHPGVVHQLLDRDLVVIDPDALVALPSSVSTGVATTLLDVERNPATGALWVTGTEANNRTRFEPNLRGAALENRVVIVVPGGAVQQTLVLEPPFTQAPHSQPATLLFGQGPGGPWAAVACLGTASVVVLDALTAGVLAEIATGEVPSGLAYDAARGALWVSTRGDKRLRAYDAAHGFLPWGPARALPYDPEPEAVTAGRTHLYDAREETGHGTGNTSCAGCHVFGHLDQLGWDLGDPGGSLGYYYPDVLGGLAGFPGEIASAPTTAILNPLKGPMTTQSLRGLMDPDTQDALPLHWRGDRRTFHMFRGAFRGLLGGSGISKRQMQAFSTFVRSLTYAPNPRQPRDREYQGLEAAGRDTYGMNPQVAPKDYVAGSGFFCISCHKGDFTNGTDFTGSRITASKGSFNQIFNTAQLRMSYEKDYKFTSGFGALHDGAVDGVRGFMDFSVPNGGLPVFPNFTDDDKDAVALFIKAWDHGLSPLVGAQWTLRADTLADVTAVLDLYEAQARPPADDVDLVVKGFRIDPQGTLLPRGAHYRLDEGLGTWGYRFDTGAFVDRSVLEFIVGAGVATFTFTCVPRGMGERLGIDRDEDGSWDFLETQAGTDPARPDSDGDGYLDGAEAALGGDPLVPDALLPDVTPPAVLQPRGLELFVDSATVSFRTDEPARAMVDVGLEPGAYDLLSFEEPPGLRRIHDVILTDLPAGTELHFRVTATDRDGNAGTGTGSFTTLPPFFHVEALSIDKSGSGPYTVTAQAEVRDHVGAPVAGVPVRAFWAGDVGGQAWQQEALTDGQGVATFALLPFTPAAPTEVAFSPAYVGSPFPSNPWFVGLGGDTPGFFYDQPSSEAHYVAIDVP